MNQWVLYWRMYKSASRENAVVSENLFELKVPMF